MEILHLWCGDRYGDYDVVQTKGVQGVCREARRPVVLLLSRFTFRH
jgi:hypothetical protein